MTDFDCETNFIVLHLLILESKDKQENCHLFEYLKELNS